ncbi:hypothetical protein M438DRAFT_342240 [Aureobasidium pullulans EXF-150]|uniref:Uncharacterized protein n=1 Tax=Aureobasidium pullulans EXF-150 TaxID=1043002 RepID=A0A074YPB5_AURPU|nr:uncharacterized protein M438DRAFT_342240 [Aureobasidium pullulans EXF-150]KEQ88676.1 hypothetical protein M438DRAFT_342240 [Aureobasidium pullulans EXF-150]
MAASEQEFCIILLFLYYPFVILQYSSSKGMGVRGNSFSFATSTVFESAMLSALDSRPRIPVYEP